MPEWFSRKVQQQFSGIKSVFITDGVGVIGQTSEKGINGAVKEQSFVYSWS